METKSTKSRSEGVNEEAAFSASDSGGRTAVHLRKLITFTALALVVSTGNGAPRPGMVSAGNVRPETFSSQDKGPVSPRRRLEHLVLEMRPSAEAQAALERTVRDLHNPSSATFHQWLSPASFAEKLGVEDSTITAAQNWLASEGLQVTGVDPSRTALYFSGTVARIEAAFHTSMHHFMSADGKDHIANVTEPLIPESLASFVRGVVALHDFGPRRNSPPIRVIQNIALGSGFEDAGANDLQVIYGIDTVHAAGISGQGQTIAVLETSDMYSAGDWLAYRRVFGLTKRFPQGRLSMIHPSGPATCLAPVSDLAEREATLDSEVATAAAPNATVVVASCANTVGDSGLNTALRNLLNGPNPPQVISISYGNSETVMSVAARQEVNLLYMQAAAQGISIFVSSGDGGADGYYNDRGTPGTHGISTSGLASTEWNVAVGGTDFEDTYFGVSSAYWSPTNSPTRQTALSYIPEIPWNGSCASRLFTTYAGFAQPYGSDGFCNSPTVPSQRLTGLTGSGGPSSCATGAPAITGVTGGSCAGYPKPAWQMRLLGVPDDGVRDLPDISLFASAGAWNHGYAICFSDPAISGTPCTDFFGISGGTSASAPLMAGIQLLINQGTGQAWGNPDSIYYALARAQFGSSGSASCDASLGSSVAANCTFHDVTQGDNDVICTPGTPNCYAPSGKIGVLSLSTTEYDPAYVSATGWDFATGIGSVNAANLLKNWSQGVTALSSSNSLR